MLKGLNCGLNWFHTAHTKKEYFRNLKLCVTKDSGLQRHTDGVYGEFILISLNHTLIHAKCYKRCNI